VVDYPLYNHVPFDAFMAARFPWRQGEHVLVCAPTGYGKSTLIGRILDKRQYVVVIGTKIHDDTYREEFLARGFKRVEQWPPPRHVNKVMFWPYAKFPTIKENAALYKERITEALNRIFKQTGWTVVIDETLYVSNELGLRAEIGTFQHQGRSSKLTNVLGFQRPAHVPLIAYDSASHAFIARSTLADDAKRLADLGGADSKELAFNMARLPKYDYIYVNTRRPDLKPVIVNVRR